MRLILEPNGKHKYLLGGSVPFPIIKFIPKLFSSFHWPEQKHMENNSPQPGEYSPQPLLLKITNFFKKDFKRNKWSHSSHEISLLREKNTGVCPQTSHTCTGSLERCGCCPAVNFLGICLLLQHIFYVLTVFHTVNKLKEWGELDTYSKTSKSHRKKGVDQNETLLYDTENFLE